MLVQVLMPKFNSLEMLNFKRGKEKGKNSR